MTDNTNTGGDFARAVFNIADNAAETIQNTLVSGSNLQALSALAGVAIVTLIPLTLIQNAYCFSVGYGASVATMSLAMMLSFDVNWTVSRTAPPAVWLVQAVLLYGVRLAAFLVWREVSVHRMRDQGKFFQQVATTKVLPLAAFLGGLYACMVSPVLYALRGETDSVDVVVEADDAFKQVAAWAGVVLAHVGWILEAMADQQKYEAKRHHKITYGEKRFVGPTGGLYRVCRHPNFLFEVVFWTGLWLAGAPSFGTNATAWVCGTLGWVSLVQIMQGSAKRLDKKQVEWYGGQPEFEQWKEKVPGSLWPSIFASSSVH